jgi:hypothetical protein
MKKNLIFTIVAVCLATPTFADTILGTADNGNLYSIVPATGATTLIGAQGVTLTDIAAFGGLLYGVDSTTNLYSIDPITGHAILIGATGQSFNSLAFDSSGVLYAAGAATTNLFTINTGTGTATQATNGVNAAYKAGGDLAFVGSTLYLTAQINVNGYTTLETVDLTTGAVTAIGTDLGVKNVYGLAYYDGVLYGFSNPTGNSAEAISIDLTTGVGTLLASYGGAGRGAFAFNGATYNGVAVPEPATLATAGIALIALGSFAFRRRTR